jgi:hypothetical protein
MDGSVLQGKSRVQIPISHILFITSQPRSECASSSKETSPFDPKEYTMQRFVGCAGVVVVDTKA